MLPPGGMEGGEARLPSEACSVAVGGEWPGAHSAIPRAPELLTTRPPWPCAAAQLPSGHRAGLAVFR